MKVEAHAKINLALDVVKRREDGYHDLRMIMLPLQLHDTLHVELAQQDELTCDDERMPLGENNLIFKALRYLRECWDLQGCFRIHVEKRIPMEAGLTEHFINHVWADIVHYIPRKMANAPSKKNTNSN